MKKKRLSLFFSLAIILMCSVSFVGCFGNKNETVTEYEWYSALAMHKMSQVKVTMMHKSDTTNLIKKGDVLYSSISREVYFNKNQNNYIGYNKDLGSWVKFDITKNDYNDILNMFNYEDVVIYTEYTFDVNLNCYVGRESSEFGMVKNPKLYFKNKKLVKVVGDYDENHSMTYLFEYSNIQLTLPQVD